MPSINIRVIAANGAAAAVPATTPFTTVFVKTADGCATTYPSQTIVNNTTTGGGLASLPEPGFPYGTYKLCAQRTVSGVTTHGHADQRTGTGTRRLRHAGTTTTVVAETVANRVDDTIANTNANGVPALLGQPHLSEHARRSRPRNGSIIIRLNRTGPCE